jgi:hypothetical protein
MTPTIVTPAICTIPGAAAAQRNGGRQHEAGDGEQHVEDQIRWAWVQRRGVHAATRNGRGSHRALQNIRRGPSRRLREIIESNTVPAGCGRLRCRA